MEPSQEKLVTFIKDSLRIGCLKGFKFFELYLRGREELVVTVLTTKFGDKAHMSFEEVVSPTKRSGSFAAIQDGLPPASPCAKDIEMMREDAVFLIGAYARYRYPYVWLRSNHQRLLDLGAGDNDKKDKDFPLKITSTVNWKTSTVKVWDIISELVSISLAPNVPENPFEIDRDFFLGLEVRDRALHSGSLAGFLRRIALTNVPFIDMILRDVEFLNNMHFMSMGELAKEL